jgi:hypothetical protein
MNSFACNANNSFVTFLLMSYVSSNLLPFSADLILRNKKKSGENKSGEYGPGGGGVDLILESIVSTIS